MASEPDHYEVLQVSPRAEPDVIEAAYRRLARRYHPDVNPEFAALQRMRELNRAFEILIDPRKRAEYDRRRLRTLAQKAMAEQQPGQPYGTLYRGNQGTQWQESLRQQPVAWLLVSGGVTVVLVGLALIILQVASESGGGLSTQQGPSASSPTPAVAGALSTPSPGTTPPAQGSGTFSNGTWLVGEEIAPGMWRALRSRDCSWKRLASIEGASDTIAGSGSYLTVEIGASDAAFWSEGCGWWTQILAPPSSTPGDPFGPGTWLVNEEIAPGLWQNSDSSEGCSWSRLSGLDGAPSSVKGTGLGHSIITIDIAETDHAFHSKGCGTWTRIEG